MNKVIESIDHYGLVMGMIKELPTENECKKYNAMAVADNAS